ncbi:MAG: YncE family protein, partial [Planctomycetota bacterium]
LTQPAGTDPGEGRLADSMLVVSAAEHALVMQDPDSGERTAFFRVGLSPDSVAVAEDGRTAVVTNRGDRLSGNSICVVDLHATNLVRTIPLEVTRQSPDQSITKRSYHRPSGVAFVPGRPRVVISCEVEGALLVVDLVQARVIGDCLLGGKGSGDVVVDHTGRFAYVANHSSGTVSVVKLDRMQLVKTIEAGGGPAGMALHPVRNEVWLTNSLTNSITIIDVEEQEERIEFACGAMPRDIAFTPDGKYALVANMQEGNVSVFNSVSRRIRTLVDLERVSEEQAKQRPVKMTGHFGRSPLPTRIMIGPDGSFAYVATKRSDQLHEIDLSNWTVTRTLSTATAPTDLAWSRVDHKASPETATASHSIR